MQKLLPFWLGPSFDSFQILEQSRNTILIFWCSSRSIYNSTKKLSDFWKSFKFVSNIRIYLWDVLKFKFLLIT